MKKKISKLIAERSSAAAKIVERAKIKKGYKLKYWRDTLSLAALSTLPSSVAKSLKDKATRTH